MKAWKDLGVVETIYEDDHEDYSSSNSPSLSPNLTASPPSPPSPLQNIVKTWSLATGYETDVVIHVQDQCFHLHKDPLISKSSYLKRHLTDSSEITLSPPLQITAETFIYIIDFCYSYQTVITPFNVAALRVAAELLEMTIDESRDNQSLRRKTESYFCQAVSVNREFATVVLRSCLGLLPEAEETAALASRCIEALGLIDGVDEIDRWVNEIISLTVDKLQLIADSMHGRLEHNHDVLYKILDYYIKENGSKITEEEKARLCICIDCNKLSQKLIMHAVQNPRMPLRFIVRAMLVEQLNTRHSIISTINNATATKSRHYNNTKKDEDEDKEPMTLGAILEREAALRHAAQLKASMEATSSKIERLEKELNGMKKQLQKTEKSSSFRFCSEGKNIGKGGESSWGSFRFSDYKSKQSGIGSECSPSSSEKSGSTSNEKRLGWKLWNGLRTAFRKSSSKQDSPQSLVSRNVGRDVEVDRNADEFDFEDEQAYYHRRTRSLL